jgi:hypothetical protein
LVDYTSERVAKVIPSAPKDKEKTHASALKKEDKEREQEGKRSERLKLKR